MSTEELVAMASPRSARGPGRPSGGFRLRRAELRWALAFILPYAAVFCGFVVYPLGYAVWMASKPALYADLVANRAYLSAVVNTLIFVGIGVNLMMFVALLLSGFFMSRHWGVRALLAVFILPWAIATAQACISFHWMLQGNQGLINRLLSELFDIDGPIWFNDRWLGIGWNIVAYMWKWLPFWTIIFLAARLTIPRQLYDAAEIDGATGSRAFVHVTFPLLANLYLLCTLLATLWTIGDFTTVYLVSGGGPAGYTDVLATLGFRYAFDASQPDLGLAAIMSALPLLIPLVVILMRRAQTMAAQL